MHESICLSVLLPVGYSHVGGGLTALSRVPSDNLPFACQFPRESRSASPFASSALPFTAFGKSLGLSSAGLCNWIYYSRFFREKQNFFAPLGLCFRLLCNPPDIRNRNQNRVQHYANHQSADSLDNIGRYTGCCRRYAI